MKRFALFFFLFLSTCATAGAQDRTGVLDDYVRNPTGQYSPSDPWIRSRVWRRHTGHWGRFYNCDCEEQKRFSPYICWKNAQCPLVGESWRYRWQRDKARILQRIVDGSCNCDCNPTNRSASCRCETCANRSPSIVLDQSQSQNERQTQPAAKPVNKNSLLARLQSDEQQSTQVADGSGSVECDRQQYQVKRTMEQTRRSTQQVAQSRSLLDKLQEITR